MKTKLALSICACLVSAQAFAQLPQNCDITGVVYNVETVAQSPWSDGVPSPLSTTETHVAVVVKSRSPHYKSTEEKPQATCTFTKEERATYKLCSPVQLIPGDSIAATEGQAPAQKGTITCLFDVGVLKK